MIFNLNSVLLVGLGIVIQSIASTNAMANAQSLKTIGTMMLIALFMLFPFQHEHHYVFNVHLAAYFFLYLILVSSKFSNQILPVVNEYTLLIFNIILLISFFHFTPLYFDVHTHLMVFQLIGLIILAPSVLVLLKSVYPFTAPDWLKLCLYVWYLCMASAILVINIILYFSVKFGIEEPNAMLNLVTLLTFGMVIFNLVSDVFNVLELIPLRSKNDNSFDDALARMRAQIALLTSKFEDEAVSLNYTAFIMIGLMAFLILNHLFLKIDDQLIVNMALLSSKYIFGDPINTPSKS